jgi:putative peptidoglycan lipid II flippase
MTPRRRIAGAALVIMVGNVASRLLGLVREQVMAWLFGATGQTDAFVAASAAPQIVYDLLVGGAISAALVPVFVEAAADEERLWRLVSTVLHLVAVLLVGAVAALALAADPLMSLLGFGFTGSQRAEAVDMVRWMLLAVVLQGLAGVLMAALYARDRFALPSLAPAVYNGGIILAAVGLHGPLGVPSLVVGVLLGAAGQLGLQVVGLRSFRYRLSLDPRLPEVRAILRLYGPVAAGMLVTIVGIVLDRYFASQLEPGSMTVMGYATRLIQFPLGLVATATAFAVLPTLSRYAAGMAGGTSPPGTLPAPGRGSTPPPRAGEGARGEVPPADGYRDTLTFGIKVVLLLMVPATLGLVVLAEPLVRLLFEHRAFTGYDTLRTAAVFLHYAPQLPLTALDQLLIFAFYARRDTVTPVLVGVLGVVGFYLPVALLTKDSLGANGLALANTAQNGGHGLVLLGLLWARIGGLDGGDLLGFTARVGLAGALMTLVLQAGLSVFGSLATAGPAGLALLLGLEVGLGAVAFGAATLALRVEEAGAVWQAMRARVGRGWRVEGGG